eukprot:2828564-Amphidinium_carterae.1
MVAGCLSLVELNGASDPILSDSANADSSAMISLRLIVAANKNAAAAQIVPKVNTDVHARPIVFATRMAATAPHNVRFDVVSVDAEGIRAQAPSQGKSGLLANSG